MNAFNDGGPAFPGMDYVSQDGKMNPPGMTLRDYFAAAALHGITNLPSVRRYKVHQLAGDWAEWSYAVADAMLAERARKEAQP